MSTAEKPPTVAETTPNQVKFDFLATQGHYLDHLLPIWEALAPEERGRFHIGTAARPRAFDRRIAAHSHIVPAGSTPLVVAAYQDLNRRRGRPAILVEHGAGQNYGLEGDGNPAYSGGARREAVRLFVCPNEIVAARNRKVYPRARVAVVGCPKLDRWHRDPGRKVSSNRQTVAISFHWEAGQRVVPEAGSAFRHFEGVLGDLAARFDLIGHAHPRAWSLARNRYRATGIEPVANFDEVLERAAIYVCDNSSTLFEFASTGRPVVLMDAPAYRREVEHGLRFWTWADMGPRTGDPAALADAISLGLADPEPFPTIRAEAVAATYTLCDGNAAQRAASAMRETFGSEGSQRAT